MNSEVIRDLGQGVGASAIRFGDRLVAVSCHSGNLCQATAMDAKARYSRLSCPALVRARGFRLRAGAMSFLPGFDEV